MKVVYKYFVVHEQAIPAGLAACAAHKQGKFAQIEPLIWEKGFKARDLSAENLSKIAAEAGLDVEKFKKDMESEECRKDVKEDHEALARVGTRGTPSFYVNGRHISGAQPFEVFRQVIDEELKKANERIARGEATVATYYDKFVLEQGKKSL